MTQEELKENGRKLIGQELTYKKMMNGLGLECYGGNKKTKQLKELQTIFEIDTHTYEHNTKYQIVRVYEQALLPLYDQNEWYKAITTRVFELMADDNGKYKDVWFTRTPMLYNLGVVNDNYKIVMNGDKRAQLEVKYKRSFDIDYKACCSAGNILADRINDSLARMEKDGYIRYSKGYVVMYYYGDDYYDFIKVVASEQDSEVYRILLEIDTLAFKRVCFKHGLDSTRNFEITKYAHYDEICAERNKIIHTDHTYLDRLLEACPTMHRDTFMLQMFYDTKFIIPNEKMINYKLGYNAKQFLNKAAVKKLSNSKNKQFLECGAVAVGFNDVYIDLDSHYHYKEDIEKEG